MLGVKWPDIYSKAFFRQEVPQAGMKLLLDVENRKGSLQVS